MNPRRDAAAYAASKRSTRRVAVIDGRRFTYVVSGEGAPVIVFLSGAGMDLDSWFLVRPEAARISSAFAYDRLGTGGSDRPATEQSGHSIVEGLRQVLTGAALAPPYVLVGHSLGGLYANLFARTHPGEVCGVVLVDSAAPGDILDRPTVGRVAKVINGAIGVIGRLTGRRGFDEADTVELTLQQLAAAPPFPPVPLVVISGGKRMPLVPEGAFRAHADHQRELVELSPQGRHLIAGDSGHFPHLQEPGLVVDAIADVVARCRA